MMDQSQFKSLRPGARLSTLKLECEDLLLAYMRENNMEKGWIVPMLVSRFYGLKNGGSMAFRALIENPGRRKHFRLISKRKTRINYNDYEEFLLEILPEEP